MAKWTIFETAVLITVILIPAHVLSAQQTADPRLALRIVDYAKVDRKTIEEAKHVALRVLARAGIGVILPGSGFRCQLT